MSAFILDKVHIDLLVTAGLAETAAGPLRWSGTDLGLDTADEVGRMLWRENLASIHWRYPDTEQTGRDYPGPISFRRGDVETYRFEVVPGPVSIAIVRKAVACYEYQSCEHAGWSTSEAWSFCHALAQRYRHDEDRPIQELMEVPGWPVYDRDVFVTAAVGR